METMSSLHKMKDRFRVTDLKSAYATHIFRRDGKIVQPVNIEQRLMARLITETTAVWAPCGQIVGIFITLRSSLDCIPHIWYCVSNSFGNL